MKGGGGGGAQFNNLRYMTTNAFSPIFLAPKHQLWLRANLHIFWIKKRWRPCIFSRPLFQSYPSDVVAPFPIHVTLTWGARPPSSTHRHVQIFYLSQNEWFFCWVSNFSDMDLFSEIVDPPPFTALHNIRIYCALRYICVHGIHNMWSRHILMMTGLYWRYIAYLASQPH